MNLKEYLLKRDMTPRQFAKIIEYTPQHIYAILAGRQKVSKKLAVLINIATQGEVPINGVMRKNDKGKPLPPISPFQESMQSEVGINYSDLEKPLHAEQNETDNTR